MSETLKIKMDLKRQKSVLITFLSFFQIPVSTDDFEGKKDPVIEGKTLTLIS